MFPIENPEEVCNKKILVSFREMFNSDYTTTIRCILMQSHLADALTNDNQEIAKPSDHIETSEEHIHPDS